MNAERSMELLASTKIMANRNLIKIIQISPIER